MKPNNVFELSPNPTLEAQVLSRLREAILKGVFEPGSQLNHVWLAEQFGVSRGPIRVALGKLEEEGLVNHVPRRGTFVTTLDHAAIEDLYNIRAVLEQYAAQEAVKKASQKDLDQLEILVKELQQAVRSKNIGKVELSDFSIHKFIVELSGNAFLEQFWSNLQMHVRWVLADRFRDFHNIEEIPEFHTTLLEKFRQKDADGAGRICWEHSIEALNEIRAKWKSSGQAPNQTEREN